MNSLRILFGLLCISVGIVGGCYVGFYFCLYGGIRDAVIYWDKDTGLVIWGIIRAVLFESFGGVAFLFPSVFGMHLLKGFRI